MIRQTKEGWWIIDGDSHIGKWVEDTGRLDHDFFTIPLACTHIPEGGVAMDLGANIGSHSYAYSQKLGTNGTLVCVEAGYNAYEALKLNAVKFQSGFRLLNVAVGKEHGTWADFVEDGQNFGASEVRKSEGNGTSVLTASIDGIMKDNDLTRLDFLKLDVEGCEPDALQGGQESIMKFRPKMLIEVNRSKLKNHDSTPIHLFMILDDLKYKWTIIQPELTEADVQYDILCKPI